MKMKLFTLTLLASVSMLARAETVACNDTLWNGEAASCTFGQDTITLLEILTNDQVAAAYDVLKAEGLNPNAIVATVKADADDNFGNTQEIALSFGQCHGPFGPAATQGARLKVSRRLNKQIMDAAIYNYKVGRIKRFEIRCR